MHNNQLSNHPPGSVRELLSISSPILLSLFSVSLMQFIDRFFLSGYSIDAFNAAALGGYLVLLFQAFCIKLTSINQVFIGRSFGEGNLQNVGGYTWQMIWCSLLMQVIVLPVSLLTSRFYFANTEVAALGSTYFTILMLGNVLFPLGATLAAFQMGLGRTRVVLIVTLIANLFKGGLDYFFINGVSGVLEPLGIKGSAITTLISQSIYCLILFYLFLNNPLSKHYQTKHWQIRFSLFKECIQVGTPFALGRFAGLFCWALSMKLVAENGGDYMLLISFISTICILTSAVNESLLKGLTTIFSCFIGQRNKEYVVRSLRSAIIVLFMNFCFLALPYLIFPERLIHFVMKTKLEPSTLHFFYLGCAWLWFDYFLEGMNYVSVSLIASFKETFHLLKLNTISAFFIVYPTYYLAFSVGNLAPDKVIMVNWISMGSVTILHLFRIKKCFEKLSFSKAVSSPISN